MPKTPDPAPKQPSRPKRLSHGGTRTDRSHTLYTAADWRLARHDIHMARRANDKGETKPYPVAIPRGGPRPTDPAAAPFLPLATPQPASSEAMSTADALAAFGFHALHEAVRACRRRERRGERPTPDERRTARAVAERIEQLAASLAAAGTAGIEVSFESPRAPLRVRAHEAAGPPRIRLRITRAGGPDDACPVPLTLDVDPIHPLVYPVLATEDGRRIDIAPGALGRLARIACADGTGIRPPALASDTLVAAARAHRQGGTIGAVTTTLDGHHAPATETCTPKQLAALLLCRCWPQPTPADTHSAWVAQLEARTNERDGTRETPIARYDRTVNTVVVDGRALNANDATAVAGLIAALRAAGRKPGERYWTHSATPYPTAFRATRP